MKKHLVLKLTLLLATFVVACPIEANADNLNIPGGYESAYHHLLEQRQHLMDDKAISVRNLVQVDSWLLQIDKALISYSPLLNRQKLLSSRTYILTLRDKFRKNLDYQESSLQHIDKDLAWLEGEMKHFACMK